MTRLDPAKNRVILSVAKDPVWLRLALLFTEFFTATQKWGSGPHASPNMGGAEQSEAEGFKTAVGVSISPTLSRW